MAKNKNTNERHLRELTKSHIWVPLVVSLIMMTIAGFAIYAFMDMIVEYTVISKYNDEYNYGVYMAKLYDNAGEANKYMDMSGRNYLIVDKDDNVIYTKGKNTCSFVKEDVWFNFQEYKTVAYRDTEVDFVHPSSEGQITLDTFRFLGVLADKESEYHKRLIGIMNEVDDINNAEDERGEKEEQIKQIALRSTIYLPIWAEHVLKDGNKIIVQEMISVGIMDVLLIILFLVLFVVIAILFLIILIVNLARTSSRNKRAMRVFFTDPVTRGHNRMWFLIKGEQYLRKGKTAKSEFAVVNLEFIDYGNYCLCHSIAEGERMLVEIQRRLDSRLSKEELCAHMNTSSFALLLKIYADEEALKERVEGIISELERIHTERAFHFQAGIAAIGVKRNNNGKIVRRRDIDLEYFYSNASAARAKLSKTEESGVMMFDNMLVEELRWVDTVQAHQQSALQNEEFVVYYQPKYNPVTDELRGAEALVRWISPEFGFIPPGRFIPIFENNGFVTELDHYMISHVARDQKAWLDAGFKCVPVSVNVSRAHFIEADLAEQIRDMVDAAQCPHEYIEIELTESAFFDDKDALVTTINRLKSYGFSVSMDDFGSGYSSLNSLKDMPLDVLKLDAEFFRGENAGERGELVVSEAIKLAKSLSMRTVAEGVEEKSQVEFLAKQGCDMIQGYFYAKPMPGAEYEQRMKDGVKHKDEEAADKTKPAEPVKQEEPAADQVIQENTGAISTDDNKVNIL